MTGKVSRRHLAGLALLLVAGIPDPASTQRQGAPSAAANDAQAGWSDAERRVLLLTNDARRDAGLAPLRAEAALGRAARAHAQAMARSGRLDHRGSDGSQPWDRGAREGYRSATYAENIGQGYASPDAAVAAWLGGAEHRRNMLDPDFTELGVGVDPGGRTWVQNFGSGNLRR